MRMVILLTGATGFIGSHLARALQTAGHEVISASRTARPASRHIQADFSRNLQMHDWQPRLAGIDVVINAVGIIRESGEQTFERLHTQAPRALFAACAAAGVQRVIQISALGADTGTAGYFRSKRAADEFLATLSLDWTIVQPSLVYGAGGTSARLFTGLASLPVIPLPGGGGQLIQPVHIDDLIQAIVNLLAANSPPHRRIAIVGPQPLTLREFLARLRESMHLRRARFIPVPITFVRLAARLAQTFRSSLLDRETLMMLEAGNTAAATATQQLLQRPPRTVEEFVPRAAADAIAAAARLGWLLPILRVSVALVWIWTGIVSLGLYPLAASYELLARTGITGAIAPLMLYGAAVLDLALGLGSLLLRKRRLLWLTQLALILFYTAIISIRLPEFWLHPYGPLLKNLPMLACIYLLYCFEDRPWNTSS